MGWNRSPRLLSKSISGGPPGTTKKRLDGFLSYPMTQDAPGHRWNSHSAISTRALPTTARSCMWMQSVAMLTRRKRLQDIDNDLQNSELKYRRHSVVKEEHQFRGLPHLQRKWRTLRPSNILARHAIMQKNNNK